MTVRRLVLVAVAGAALVPVPAYGAEECATADVRCVRYCWDVRLDPAQPAEYASRILYCLT